MGLVIEFERIIGVREVLLRLFFDFPVGFDPTKKLGAVARVFGHSGLISFKGFVVPRFLCQRGLPAIVRQISGKIVAAGKSSGVKKRASNHHRNARHYMCVKMFFQLSYCGGGGSYGGGGGPLSGSGKCSVSSASKSESS